MTCSLHAQYKEIKLKLPKELNEISGIEIINDSLFVAINDSGNKQNIYFVSTKGEILHTCFISNGINSDWEAITMDNQGHLYIADVGNNLNNRNDFCIYKIEVQKARILDSIVAEKILFNYNNSEILLKGKSVDYDCEALFWQNDSLYLVMKSHAKPWNGKATIYSLATDKEKQNANPSNSIYTGNKGWKFDSVTSSDTSDDDLYLLTYNKMIIYNKVNGSYVRKESYKFKKYNQKEAIAVGKDKILIGAEKHRFLGGPFLYIITKK